MKKVAIVGVEGSGKTVMLAGLGDLYTYPDEDGYFLAPKNFGTAAYVAEKIERMRKGEWPVATAGDEMQGLDWTLKRRRDGVKGRPDTICEVSFLDFAGEVYRAAYGISGGGDPTLKEQVKELKQYVCGADDLIVLINLRDVIVNGLRDKRVQEAMWITKSILDTALGDDAGTSAPRTAIVLSQADSYASTIESCGGALGVLRRHLPHVANDYDWLDVFAVNAVDKTVLDDDGNLVPAVDFTSQGLLPILKWVCRGAVSDGGDSAIVRSAVSMEKTRMKGEETKLRAHKEPVSKIRSVPAMDEDLPSPVRVEINKEGCGSHLCIVANHFVRVVDLPWIAWGEKYAKHKKGERIMRVEFSGVKFDVKAPFDGQYRIEVVRDSRVFPNGVLATLM